MVAQLLNIKIKQAEREQSRESKRFVKSKESLWMEIPWTSLVAEEFRCILRQEICIAWTRGKQTVAKKADHLLSIYGRKQTPDMISGVKVSDNALKELFTPEPTAFITPGVTDVSENIKAALKLPPQTTIHSKIDLEEVEVKVEESLHKARWELRSRDVGDLEGQIEEEAVDERVNQLTLLNNTTKTINLSKMCVTDLPTCREVNLPDPRPEEREIQLRAFKEDVMRTVTQYKQKKCDIGMLVFLPSSYFDPITLTSQMESLPPGKADKSNIKF